MFVKKICIPFTFFALAACGGGGDVTYEVPSALVSKNLLQLPLALGGQSIDTVQDTSEVDKGYFNAYIAESVLGDLFAANDSEVLIARRKVWTPEPNVFVLERSDGSQIVFRTDGGVPDAGTNTKYRYTYSEENSEDGFLELTRFQRGETLGRYQSKGKDSFVGLQSQFWFGWPIDNASLPSMGTAKFESPNDGILFTSDGRVLWSGAVDLTADFSAGEISGTLFNNIGKGVATSFWGLELEVTVDKAQINNDGTIGGANNISVVSSGFADTRHIINPGTVHDPFSGAPVITASSLEGEFVGNNPEAVIGAYEMSGTIARTGAGPEPFKASGGFSAHKK